MGSAWDEAFRNNKRVFYEAGSETLRTCPENYLVAVVTKGGRGPLGDVIAACPDAALSYARDAIDSALTLVTSVEEAERKVAGCLSSFGEALREARLKREAEDSGRASVAGWIAGQRELGLWDGE